MIYSPKTMVPAWKSTTRLERFLDCIEMLSLHDILTDSETKRLRKRIAKWERMAYEAEQREAEKARKE